MDLDAEVQRQAAVAVALEDGQVLVEHQVLVGDQLGHALGHVGARPVAAAGHLLVDAGRRGRLGLAGEQDGEAVAGDGEVEGQAHRRRRPADLREDVVLDQRVLAAGDERVVVVAVGRVVGRAHLPAVAVDLVRADVGGLGRTERLRVHRGEVGGVEEVVGELEGAGDRAAGLGPGPDERRVVPLGELVEVAHGRLGRQPHEPVALDHARRRGRGTLARARRRRRRWPGWRCTPRGVEATSRGSDTPGARRRRPSRPRGAPADGGSGPRTPAPARRGARAPRPGRAAARRPARRRPRRTRPPDATPRPGTARCCRAPSGSPFRAHRARRSGAQRA